MLKMIRLCCALPVLMLAHTALAAEAAPVDLVSVDGKQPAEVAAPAEAADASPVDSALSDSMEAPLPAPKNTYKTTHKSSKSSKKTVTAHSASAPAADGAILANDKNYTIQAGDVLQITVWKEADMDRETLVLPDGTVSFPLIGSFTAQGMTPAQVQATIRSKLKTLIPDASVTVVVKAALGHSVSVIGQVSKPGELVMSHPLTVMQALSQAGGLTAFASESRIKVLRTDAQGKQTSIDFPYDDISEGENLDKNITLQPGDVVVVPTAGLF